MKINSMKCPNCGAPLSLEEGQSHGVCSYCGSDWILENFNVDDASDIQEKPVTKNKSKLIAGLIVAAIVAVGCISGLVNKMAQPRIDPFENLSVTFSGLDGEGTLSYKNTGTGDLSELVFKPSKEYGLSNGDIVTFKVRDLNGYRFTRETTEFEVTGLDEYLSSLDQLSDEMQTRIHNASALTLQTCNKSSMNMFPDDASWSEPEYIGQYLLVAKDGYDNWHGMNRVYDLYHSVITTPSGETYDIYQPMMFEDIVVKADGTIDMDFNCTLEAGLRFGDEIGMGITSSFNGFLSEAEMYYGVVSGNEGSYTVYVAEGTNTY